MTMSLYLHYQTILPRIDLSFCHFCHLRSTLPSHVILSQRLGTLAVKFPSALVCYTSADMHGLTDGLSDDLARQSKTSLEESTEYLYCCSRGEPRRELHEDTSLRRSRIQAEP